MLANTFVGCVALAVAGIPGAAHAATFAIESPSLRSLPSEVVAAIRADPSHPGANCSFVGAPVDLSTDRAVRGYVATTADVCDWGAAVGPIWLIVATPKPAVVLADTGYSLRLGSHASNGLLDATVTAATAGWSLADSWAYDGTRYVLKHRKKASH